MLAEDLAIDGSIVQMEGEFDLSESVTATGWAVTPALMQSHPFAVHRRGHSDVVERAAREHFDDLEITTRETFALKGGELRVGIADLPNAHGGRRQLTVGAWEGGRGSLSTSIVGSSVEKLVEVFDTLEFSESERGLRIDSPVVPRPRTPEVARLVPDLGVVSVRPAIASELERVPRGGGRRTRHGEVFRAREGARSLVLLSPTSVVDIHPLERADDETLVDFADRFRVEWRPRGRGAR
ncbi:MAG: hypothetical protein AAGC60_24635 [Acidobacteriota bacterium]